MPALNILKYYTEIECCSCGVVYFISTELDNSYKKTKNSFYCPNGHSQSYVKSAADQLRETLQEKNIELQKLRSDLEASELIGIKLARKLRLENNKKNKK